ncbi:hypothetical protein ACV35F_33880, partial [Pseudomonas aeruginosa]
AALGAGGHGRAHRRRWGDEIEHRGDQGGGYAVFAGKLREKLKEQGFELKLVPSAGSRDNLERLLGTGEVDIALVQ